jgi:hypothetical protein
MNFVSSSIRAGCYGNGFCNLGLLRYAAQRARLIACEQLGPSRFLTAEPALCSFVMILQRDHQAFHGTQGADRDHYDQRQPQRRVNPIGWMEQNLCDQGGADDDRAGEKHDEYGRPVSGIGKCVIKTAMLTMRQQRQKALEQLALAATRTRTR